MKKNEILLSQTKPKKGQVLQGMPSNKNLCYSDM